MERSHEKLRMQDKSERMSSAQIYSTIFRQASSVLPQYAFDIVLFEKGTATTRDLECRTTCLITAPHSVSATLIGDIPHRNILDLVL